MNTLGNEVIEGIDEQLARFIEKREIRNMPGVLPVPQDVIGEPGDAEYRPGSPGVRWLGSSTRKSYAISARLTIRSKGYPQADLLFGRIENRQFRVSLVPGAGAFLLQRVDADGKAGAWSVVHIVRDVPALVVDKPLALRLWVRGTQLGFSLGGKSIFETDVGARLIGKWGVGGPLGSVSSWSKVRIR